MHVMTSDITSLHISHEPKSPVLFLRIEDGRNGLVGFSVPLKQKDIQSLRNQLREALATVEEILQTPECIS